MELLIQFFSENHVNGDAQDLADMMMRGQPEGKDLELKLEYAAEFTAWLAEKGHVVDPKNKNAGTVCEILNAYTGEDWCNDVLCQFDWWADATTMPVDNIDAFIFLDEDDDLVRVYWHEGHRDWRFTLESDFGADEG